VAVSTGWSKSEVEALAPRLSDRYAIRREIGRGGMATVYLADDLKHDRQVAIKVLLPALSAAIGADRFAREIRTVARLQHPHILPLFDSGDADGILFFVMPFVNGESLRDRLQREGSLTLAATAGIIRQIGDALDYAHGQGVVHRDVKPENILLSGGHALLADFGVARPTPGKGLETLTSAGVTLGTPAYMSPEQASGEREIDGRSDLYALGCITHELLTGSPPFSGQNAMATMAQHVTKPPPRLVAARGQVSEDVVLAVGRMLAKGPQERFETASAFASVLEAAVIAAEYPSVDRGPPRVVEKDADARQTVCVLDFTNIARSPEVDWLSGGIAETISVDLRKIRGIRVVGGEAQARQKVAAAASAGAIEAETARRLGRSVGARWVVWGAFQKSGTRVRLTPQFSDVETGETFGVDKIDGSIEDVFELQDRIVIQLTEILRIELTSQEAEQIAKPETVRLSAYELYARGKQAFLVFGKESARAASQCFQQAIDIDPDYALAWAGLGSLLMPKYISSGSAADLDEGVHALQRALQLDPALGEPYAFLSYMYTQQHRYDEAVDAARASLERDPGAFMGWYLLGLSLASRGVSTGILEDLARAVLPLLRCRAINPSFHPADMIAGWLYMLRGQYAHSTLLVEEAVELELAGSGHLFLGAVVERAVLHARAGETGDALILLDQAIAKYSGMDHVYAEMMTAWALFNRGRVAEREADYGNAGRDFENACRIAEGHDHRLGIGSHWVNAKLGLARLAWRRGAREASELLLGEAVTMLKDQPRFLWTSAPGCSRPEAYYELAATHACRNGADQALDALGVAVRLGWADARQLSHDPCFGALRESQAVGQLLARATCLVTLPEPTGAGGFPDLSEPRIATASRS
jgi:eukaryotic-like serine/threonine-protein kinase